MLTYDEAHSLLSYDQETGQFVWKVKPRKNQEAGSRAGAINSVGYVMISVRKRRYLAHRLAWLMTNGRWPEHEIDHINGERADNRLRNLREATRSTNEANKGLRRDNTSGVKGVHWYKAGQRWQANIRLNGKAIHLGYFLNKEDAIRERRNAAERIFGAYARHE